MKKSQLSRRPHGRTKNQAKPTRPHRADPETQNESRARCAAAALAEFRRQTGTALADAVGDLLADLMHWCDQFGQAFPEALRRARKHYAAEAAARSEPSTLPTDKF